MKIRTLKRRARPAAAVLIILFIAGAIAALAIPAPGNNRPTEQPTLTPEELEALDENLVRGYSEETVSPDEAMNVAVDFLAMTAIQKVIEERTREPWTESQFIEALLAPPPRECARRSLTPDSTARTVSERMLNCIRQDLNHRNQAANWPGFTSIQKEAEARRSLWNLWESVNPATRFRAAIIIVQGADPASDPAFLEFSAELEQEACLERTGNYAPELAGLLQPSRTPQAVWLEAIEETASCLEEATKERFPPNPQVGVEEDAQQP